VAKDEYRVRAQECLRIAQDVVNPQHKAALIAMADAWLRLHDQAARNSQADLSYETPPRRSSVAQQQQQQQQRSEPNEGGEE
jgi:hypothetical protein